MAEASTAGVGAAGDRIHLEDALAPAVAATATRAASGGAGAASATVVPEGADGLSVAVAGKMVDWPGETAGVYTAAGQRGAYLGAAAGAAMGGLNAADGANAGAVEGVELEDV